MQYFIQNTKGLELASQLDLAFLKVDSKLDTNFPKIVHFEIDSEGIFDQIFAFEAVYKFILSQELHSTSELKDILDNLVKTYSSDISVVSSIVTPKIDRLETKGLLDEYSKQESKIKLKIWINKDKILIGEEIRKANVEKHYQYEESLKFNIAYSILLLLTQDKDNFPKSFFDGFCGSGTFLEAATKLKFKEIIGQDISKLAVGISQSRNPSSKIILNDTTRNFPKIKFDFAFSNLPWNNQVKILSHTELYTKTFDNYFNLTKPNGKFGFLLMKAELMQKISKKYKVKTLYNHEIGFLGQNPTMLIFQKD